MRLEIIIPMTQDAAEDAERGEGEDWRMLWPEVECELPLLPADVATEVQAVIECWVDRDVDSAVIVTRSEMVVLRARRMVAEGAPLDVTVHFPGSDHPSTEVSADGEVGAWPGRLFSEDFEEVRAIRRAGADKARVRLT